MSTRRRRQQHTPTKGERLREMARKKEERAARVAYRKEKKAESYLADDETFNSFSNQLAKSGLELRDIPGDGNCLFRALADQMDGHCRNHYKHRLDVATYMLEHRDDFEPFVEDDVPFERHVSNLKKPGTFAGNDAIVAFSRLFKVNIVIHQLNSPCWQIQGSDANGARQLHISYHNGDHYSSVRKVGDNSSTPAKITISAADLSGNSSKKLSKDKKHTSATYDDDPCTSYDLCADVDAGISGMVSAVRTVSDVEDYIISETGCTDRSLVQQTLQDNNYCVDSSIAYLMQIGAISNSDLAGYGWGGYSDDRKATVSSNHTYDSGIWSDNGAGARLFDGIDDRELENGTQGEDGSGAKPKALKKGGTTTRERKETAKRMKKKRAEERHRQKILGATNSVNQPSLSDSDDGVTVEKKLSILQI